MRSLRTALARVTEDRLLLALLLALPLLLALQPKPAEPALELAVVQLMHLVHWPTLLALAGFMLLSRGIEDSHYLSWWLARSPISHYSPRLVVVLLCGFAALLAAIITNDVALYILVPLALNIARVSAIPPLRLVIFLAFAVNAGSSLSPIGNPQNLLLWQAANLSFLHFTLIMLPLALGLMALVITFVPFAFKDHQQHANPQPLPVQALPARKTRLFWFSLAGYPAFILAIEYGWVTSAFFAIVLAYAVGQRKVVLGIDWLLLLLFALMFIDLGLLAQLPIMQQLTQYLLALPGATYTATVVLSQVISNVPATIYLLQQLGNEPWLAIAYGASVGGFGFVLGSMANLIALRLVAKSAPQPGAWWQFHRFALPLLGLGWLLGVLLLAFVL